VNKPGPVCGGIHPSVTDQGNCGMYVHGRLGQLNIDMLIDSGANISIVNHDVYMSLEAGSKPPLRRYETPMVTADGTPMLVYGSAEFSLQVGDDAVPYRHRMCVADVGIDMIMGYDFLKKYQAVMDVGKGQLELLDAKNMEDDWDREGQPVACSVMIARTIVIPAGEEAIAQGKCVGKGDVYVGMVEPLERFQRKHGVMMASAVVTTGEKGVPVRLFNAGETAVTLYKNTAVAKCAPVQVLGPGGKPGPREDSWKTVGVPSHLTQLYEEGCKELGPRDQERLADLLHEYGEVFSSHNLDMGRTGLIPHRIDTKGAHPIKQRLRRVPMHMKGIVQEEVQRLLDRDLIEPSISPWASSLVLVKKKNLAEDGSTQYRVCIDYRPLNEVTIKDSYPTQKCDACLDALVGSRWYCCMDLMSGYHQVTMHPEDKEKTAFHTDEGLFQWRVMSMGLANASATFNRVLERILTGIPPELCVLYIDDVLVHAPTCDEMFGRLRIVLDRIKKAGLKFKPNKCFLFRRQVAFLGHQVSGDGVKPDPEKTKVVEKWPQPRCTKDVRAFLGLCGYYRRFVAKFADIARPLYRLTEKDQDFSWPEEAQLAFQRLKDMLCNAPILAYPDISRPFTLDCDASNEGLGAVLSQVGDDGSERPVAYHARAFSKTEKRYCVTRRELLACVGSIKHFHHYLMGAPFVVRTDHNSLTWLCHFRELDGQLARWLEALAQYDFRIIHRQGKQHGNADGLSRRPCVEDECRHCEKAELVEYSVGFVRAASEWLDARQEAREIQVENLAGGYTPGWGEDEAVTVVRAFDEGGPGSEPVSDPSFYTENLCGEDIRENGYDEREILVVRRGTDGLSGINWENVVPVKSKSGESREASARDEGLVAPLQDAGGQPAPLGEGGKVTACDPSQDNTFEELIGVLGHRTALVAAQLADPHISPILNLLRTQSAKPEVGRMVQYSAETKRYWAQWESLVIMGGVLYRKFESEAGHRYLTQAILPQKLRKEFLTKIHCHKTCGHLGIKKTQSRVMQRAYWFKWRDHVTDFCRQCDMCASRKPPPRKGRAPMQQHLTGEPMERVSMDIMGPLPKTERGNKFLLLICDYFTKWVEAYPLPNQEAHTIADKFVQEFICRYGVPRRIITDQGSNFQSMLFKEVCALLDIEKTRTTPYHPQCDGLVERMNRTLEAMLSMFISPGQNDWDEFLPYIMMAYRSAVQETTGYSPSRMMLGREAELPIDIMLGLPPEGDTRIPGVPYVNQLGDKLNEVYQCARERMQIKSDLQKKYYDVRAHGPKFEPGDFVWMHNPARKVGISPKLSRTWEGPYLVITRLSNVTYRIQRNARAKLKIVHFDRLKPYRGTPPVSWVVPSGGAPSEQEWVVPVDTMREEGVVAAKGGNTTIEPRDGYNDETVLYDPNDVLPLEDDETILYEPVIPVDNNADQTMVYDVADFGVLPCDNNKIKVHDAVHSELVEVNTDFKSENVATRRSKRHANKPARFRDV
jgi:hypothetical protein